MGWIRSIQYYPVNKSTIKWYMKPWWTAYVRENDFRHICLKGIFQTFYLLCVWRLLNSTFWHEHTIRMPQQGLQPLPAWAEGLLVPTVSRWLGHRSLRCPPFSHTRNPRRAKKRRAVMMRLISCSMWAAKGLRDQWGMKDLGTTESFSCLSKLVDDILHSWDKRGRSGRHTQGRLTPPVWATDYDKSQLKSLSSSWHHLTWDW